MQVTVTGEVPVYVVIDTETGEVDRVIVDDEHFTHLGDDACDETGMPISDQAIIERAIAIVDGDVDWPAWEFGW